MAATRSSATHGVVVAKSNRVRHCGRFLSGLVPAWRIRLHEDEDHVVVVPLRYSECECACPQPIPWVRAVMATPQDLKRGLSVVALETSVS
jgi:hypothetical protein